MPAQTLTIVKATGQDECLAPLTLHRAKAAVPFGGKFRIIDFTLANCLHSGLRQILGEPGFGAARGAAGRGWVEQAVSPAAVATAYEDLIAGLIGRRGR